MRCREVLVGVQNLPSEVEKLPYSPSLGRLKSKVHGKVHFSKEKVSGGPLYSVYTLYTGVGSLKSRFWVLGWSAGAVWEGFGGS